MSRRAWRAIARAVARARAPGGSRGPAARPSSALTFDEAVRPCARAQPDGGRGRAGHPAARRRCSTRRARCSVPPSTAWSAPRSSTTPRGFDGNITQPRTQSTFNADRLLPLPGRQRAGRPRRRPPTRCGVAPHLGRGDAHGRSRCTAARGLPRRHPAQRQLEIAIRNRETAQALAEYARVRLEAGQGSRLNYVRSSQELAASEGAVELAAAAPARAQEALGVAIFADAPRRRQRRPGAGAGRSASPATTPGLEQRPDVRLLAAQAAGGGPRGARRLEVLAAQRGPPPSRRST